MWATSFRLELTRFQKGLAVNKSKDEVTKVVSPVKNIVISNKNIHYKSNFKNKTKLKTM